MVFEEIVHICPLCHQPRSIRRVCTQRPRYWDERPRASTTTYTVAARPCESCDVLRGKICTGEVTTQGLPAVEFIAKSWNEQSEGNQA